MSNRFYNSDKNNQPNFSKKLATILSCGQIKQDLTLKDRFYICDCGLTLDRDLNVALNLN
jgi:hypothetical protein